MSVVKNCPPHKNGPHATFKSYFNWQNNVTAHKVWSWIATLNYRNTAGLMETHSRRKAEDTVWKALKFPLRWIQANKRMPLHFYTKFTLKPLQHLSAPKWRPCAKALHKYGRQAALNAPKSPPLKRSHITLQIICFSYLSQRGQLICMTFWEAGGLGVGHVPREIKTLNCKYR